MIPASFPRPARKMTGRALGPVVLRQPTHLHDFTAQRVEITPAAAGSVIERGLINARDIVDKAAVGVFAPNCALGQLDITNENRGGDRAATGVALGWQDRRADHVLLVGLHIHDVGRLSSTKTAKHTVKRTDGTWATNHDHGIYAEQVTGGRGSNLVIVRCADRGLQLYPGTEDCVFERGVIHQCGEGIIFSGGNEGLGYQYSKRNVMRWFVLVGNLVANRYLVESDNSKPDAANMVERCGLGGRVQPSLIGVTVRDCIGG